MQLRICPLCFYPFHSFDFILTIDTPRAKLTKEMSLVRRRMGLYGVVIRAFHPSHYMAPFLLITWGGTNTTGKSFPSASSPKFTVSSLLLEYVLRFSRWLLGLGLIFSSEKREMKWLRSDRWD
ncbi:hypothetical protein OCU04_011728 [Sclerotinia nivalis]|uniref:Uncharacterized protein n=1 Tax=Sclerotinia nivalis TaxID=352851 RepID=A0A9X0A9X4_9HELO|nr:hypothetical protein OCU04_011728 [Sclerotinia nivalis]